jgi:hypothetical protein
MGLAYRGLIVVEGVVSTYSMLVNVVPPAPVDGVAVVVVVPMLLAIDDMCGATAGDLPPIGLPVL